jgi:hypothetical protein
LLLTHASWLVAKSQSDFALPLCVRKGLQRKSRRICISKSEELKRKARFLALCAKNVPKFRITNEILNRLLAAIRWDFDMYS